MEYHFYLALERSLPVTLILGSGLH